jgi:hypothetical protein
VHQPSDDVRAHPAKSHHSKLAHLTPRLSATFV